MMMDMIEDCQKREEILEEDLNEFKYRANKDKKALQMDGASKVSMLNSHEEKLRELTSSIESIGKDKAR